MSRKRSSPPLRHATLHILLALAEGERHGYAIKQEAEERSEGAVRLGPGTLYEALARLEKERLIRESKKHAGDHAQRRYYALTSAGRKVLEAEVERLGDLVALGRSRLRSTT